VISLSLSGALALIALAYSGLLAFKLLAQSNGDTIANTLLATFCLSMAAWMWGTLARDMGLYVSAPHFLYVVTPAFYLVGPVLFAYTKRITVGSNPFDPHRSWSHLAPFVLFIVAAIPFYRLSATEKLHIFQGTQTVNIFLAVMLGLMVPHMLVYTLMCLRPIRRYEVVARDNFSDLERGNLRWLKRLCVGMLILLILDVSLPSLLLAMNWNISGIDRAAIMRMCLLLYIVFIAFSALGQPPFMYKETLHVDEAPVPSGDASGSPFEAEEKEQIEKYARSGLRDDSARYYVGKLHALMRNDKTYLDCDLTLRTLANMLKLRPHHLSQILNEQLGKSFYDYVNEHRITHAKELLADKANVAMSILDIAFASGYNNKVSFYNAFKRFVGMTPTRYREQQAALTDSQRQ
jgi:AraC-like DNA-binding protein